MDSTVYPSFSVFLLEIITPNNRGSRLISLHFGPFFGIVSFLDFSFIQTQMSADIGIFGLSTRANNLALHFALQGLEVAIGNRSSDMAWIALTIHF